ncbi:Uncharacterized protein Rs2_48694 [Raphanus sativus]|nr:Uncharacterized protein Rs2_48694 [Raphanus sativus]
MSCLKKILTKTILRSDFGYNSARPTIEVTKKVGGNYSKILRGERDDRCGISPWWLLVTHTTDALALWLLQHDNPVSSFMARHVQVLVKLGQTNVTEMVQCRQFVSVKERCNVVGS